MLISHRKNFIYTKTLKTGGTSVESYFEKYCMPEGEWEFSHAREQYVSRAGIIGYRGGSPGQSEWLNHMSAQQIKQKIGNEVWDSYFKFCVVRNPYDKMVSAFFGFGGGKPRDPKSVEKFRKWLKRGIFVDRDKYVIGNDLCVDYIMQYEQLEQDLESVCARINVPFEPESLPKLKAGYRDHLKPVSEYYDEECTQIIKNHYSYELNLFNYKP